MTSASSASPPAASTSFCSFCPISTDVSSQHPSRGHQGSSAKSPSSATSRRISNCLFFAEQRFKPSFKSVRLLLFSVIFKSCVTRFFAKHILRLGYRCFPNLTFPNFLSRMATFSEMTSRRSRVQGKWQRWIKCV